MAELDTACVQHAAVMITIGSSLKTAPDAIWAHAAHWPSVALSAAPHFIHKAQPMALWATRGIIYGRPGPQTAPCGCGTGSEIE